MLKDKKKLLFVGIFIIIIILIIFNVVKKLIIENELKTVRNSYEEIIFQLSLDDFSNNAYLLSVSVETDFQLKDKYNSYDTQYDYVNIIFRLSDEFESLELKERATVLHEIDTILSNILNNWRSETGYSALLKEEYVKYKGSNVHIEEYLNIDYDSSLNSYAFYNNYTTFYVGSRKYDLKWDEMQLVSLKESTGSSSGAYYEPTEDYNSLTYHEVTDDEKLGEVWAMAKSFIKDQLKSPSSAKFPTYNDNQVSITNSGNYYKVTGYVDAENSFGAELRSTFSLTLEQSGNKYILKECNIY